MKTLFFIFLMAANQALGTEVAVARQLFLESYNGREDTERFFDYLHQQKHSHPVLKGYTGVSEIMKCRYVFSPFTKLAHFRKGRELLEAAISEDKTNVELRLLRFAIQTNVPPVLAYNEHIFEDKTVLWRYLQTNKGGKKEMDIYRMVGDYLLWSAYVNEKEKLFIKSFCQ